MRFMGHAIFGSLSPSAVLLYRGPGNFSVMYYSDGQELSGCSVAVRTTKGVLYIGQVFDPFILRCTTMKKESL